MTDVSTLTEDKIESFTVIVPTFNEEEGIDKVLGQLCALAKEVDGSVEVIVVDDGSEDQTIQVAAKFQGVTLLRHRTNRGYGAALKTGIRHARHKLVCITDADGTYPNGRIPELVTRLTRHRCDMVVGARIGKPVMTPLSRRPAKWALTQLARLVVGEPIPDLNSGLRVLRRDVALRFFSLLPDSFSFTTTLSLAMLTNGYSVEYIPVDYHARMGRSKIRPVQDTLNFFNLVLRAALYFAPLKIFLPISALLLLLALAVALYTKFVLGQLADVSTVIIVMAAVQVGVVGLLGELVNRRLPNFYRDED